ncbi:MAG TPA: phosphatidate cytidylyltransferase [Clostridia bacterium]|nr:phosphatidate cytidylyltransferase [Clostridia bacterium]
MKRIVTAAVLIPLVLISVFRAPIWMLAALAGLVAVLAIREYLDIAAAYGAKPFTFLTYLFTITIFAQVIWASSAPAPSAIAVLVAAIFFFLFTPFVFLCAGMVRDDLRSVLPGAAVSYFGLPYVGFSLACLVFLRMMPGGWFYVLFTFLVVWVGDTAAYYVGRSMGRLKFSPRISPKKTWEGAIASLVGAVIVGCIATYFAPEINRGLVAMRLLVSRDAFADTPMWVPAVLALVINAAAQVGDLFESLIKRGAGVKDSGSILPGHGGMLDRIDALLFAVPVALILFGATIDKFIQMP